MLYKLKPFIFLLILSAIAFELSAQRIKVNRMVKRLEAAEWADMQVMLNEYKEDYGEDATYLFLQAKKDMSNLPDQGSLRLSIQKIRMSIEKYPQLDQSDREHYCEKKIYCAQDLVDLQHQAILLLWDQIRLKRDLKEIEGFIKEFPDLNEMSMVITVRDEVAFQEIEQSNDRRDFDAYIKKYPKSLYVEKARENAERLAYDEAVRLHSIHSLEGFIEEFPHSQKVDEARDLILKIRWENVKRSDDYAMLSAFYKEFSNTKYGEECKKILVSKEWEKLKGTHDIFELEKWQKENALFPEGEWALAKLKEMKNFALPFLNTDKKYFIYHMLDGSIDRTVQYDDFLILHNGDMVVKVGSHYGLLDRQGKVKINPIYDQIEIGKDAYLVRINRAYQILRPDGTWLNLPYKEVAKDSYKTDDFLKVYNLVKGQTKVGVIDWQGRVVVPMKFDNIYFLVNAIVAEYDNMNMAGHYEPYCELYNFKGDLLHLAKRFEELGDHYVAFTPFNDEIDELYGIIDTSGNKIFDAQFSSVSGTLEKGVFKVSYTESSGIVDVRGKERVSPIHSNYSLHWLGNDLYTTGFFEGGPPTDNGQLVVKNAQDDALFMNGTFSDVISFGPRGKYFIVRGSDFIEIYDVHTKKKIDRALLKEEEDQFPSDYFGDGYDGDGYLSPDLTVDLEPSPFFPEDISFEETKIMIERSQYAMNVLGNALWIDSLTGRFIKVFSKAYLIDYFGKYGFLYRNQKYQIVDIQDKIVFSDVQMAYPISVNQFFVIQNKDGERISSVFDTQQEKVVLQFPEEVDRVEKFPHYYVISGTSKYCFLINGVKLSE